MELADILKGEYFAPHVSIWHYKLDEIEEVSDPAMWVKANPNLGMTVSYETYQLDVERAEKAPASRNDILAKRFGIPMEGYTYFFTYEETLTHRRTRILANAVCSWSRSIARGRLLCVHFPVSAGTRKVWSQDAELHHRTDVDEASCSYASQVRRIYQRRKSSCHARKYSGHDGSV